MFEGISIVNIQNPSEAPPRQIEVCRGQEQLKIIDSGLLVQTPIEENRLFLIKSKKTKLYLSYHNSFSDDKQTEFYLCPEKYKFRDQLFFTHPETKALHVFRPNSEEMDHLRKSLD